MVQLYTVREFPEILLPTELDEYLAKGWYRMGQCVFTCNLIIFDGIPFGSIWLRQDLKTIATSKRRLKKKKIVQEKFRIEYGRFKLTQQKENLYKKYKQFFKGKLANSLKEVLHDSGNGCNIFNSFEVRIFDEDKLIAFSLFDIGAKSIASITGVYDPDYSKYSLGLVTMLLEMDWGIYRNMDYYYPGYLVPDYNRFDYKLNISKTIEFYCSRQKKWFSFEKDFSDRFNPQSTITAKLNAVIDSLKDFANNPSIYVYPLFEINMSGYYFENMLEHPMFLDLSFLNPSMDKKIICTYNFWTDDYEIIICGIPRDSLMFILNGPLEPSDYKIFTELLIKYKVYNLGPEFSSGIIPLLRGVQL